MRPYAKDMFFSLPPASVQLQGILKEKISLVTEGTLKKIDFYALADYFRNTMDMFATGEFWGKLMRAACLICGVTEDAELRGIIDRAAEDMMSLQVSNGDLSTCPVHTQPKGSNGSDLWERKYVLMGLLSYYELTGCDRALEAARRLVVYTESQVGLPPKTPITETGWAFCGIESSSILEPVMRVYHLTGEPAALSLGAYIVGSGCCARENIFEAIRAGKAPKDIGWNGVAKESIAKAYEMMSCFEGLCEYYRATDDAEALDTSKLFWDKVMAEEITLLGSGGADAPFNLGPGIGEQWNFTKFEQTNPDIDLMMETCVTVYWMRLCYRLLCLTGDIKYADELEKSLYNAILGAIRPDGAFFEYFPRFNGARNPKVNYSFNIKGFDLSCCTANGPTGLGLAPYFAVMGTADGVAVNLYETCTVNVPTEDGFVTISMDSQYPRMGMVNLKILKIEGKIPEKFVISLRVPAFAEDFTLMDARNPQNAVKSEAGTYLRLAGNITEGDEWLIAFDIPLAKHQAPHGSNRAGDNYIALTYGSILLARDSRDGTDPLMPVKDGEITDYCVEAPRYGGYLGMTVTMAGQEIRLTDYMSAGNAWNGGSFAAWLPTQF